MIRWRQLQQIAPSYLYAALRREWQLVVLALMGLAPGVATLTAWLNLAFFVQRHPSSALHQRWLLPQAILSSIGPQGVLVGAGVVTLLISCLGLANVYLASAERRTHEFALLMGLGLRRVEAISLLMLEILLTGLLGSCVGLIMGLFVSRLSWPVAQIYFQFQSTYTLEPISLVGGLGIGMLSALLFMGLSAMALVSLSPLSILRHNANRAVNRPVVRPLLDSWRAWKTSVLGACFAAILTLCTGLFALSPSPAFILTGIALSLSGLLSGGGWLLTRFYHHLPKPGTNPVWTLAVQGLARHPNHTAGMTLALTTGSYAVGLSVLSWLDYQTQIAFSFWVAGLVLVAGATLVLTSASLAALERRQEFGLLMALGARSSRIWQLILWEYGIVAVGGGSLGAIMALFSWIGSNGHGDWWMAIGVVVADVLAALLSAWAGAIPVLWLVTRRSPGKALRG